MDMIESQRSGMNIDEEEGSKEAQCHEAQHGSRAPMRAPLRYGAMDVLP